MKRISTIMTLSFLISFFVCSSSFAAFPEKPISVIVPHGAGGGSDTQARLLLKYVEEILGVSMIVVNRPGAGGEIGMTQLSKTKADGYTLGVFGYPDMLIRATYMDTQYKMDDFVYIATIVNSPVIFMVGAFSPYKTLDSLITETKKKNKVLTVAMAGDSHYLTMKMFCDLAGIKFTPIFFKSGNAALNAVLGGHVDTAAIAVQFGVVGQDSGATVLAVANDTQVPSLPSAKTFKEQGYDVQVKQSRILVAPKGTPQEIIDIIQQAAEKAVFDEELKSKVEAIGEVYAPLHGEKLKQYITTTEQILVPVVKESAADFVSGQK